MRARGDLKVLSEPFSVPYYLGDTPVSDRFAGSGSEASLGEWSKVAREIEEAAQRGPVFVKDMAYHVAPCLGHELVRGYRNTFIVRHPGRSLRSLKRLFPDFTAEEAGFEQQHRLMRLVAEACSGDLVVIDGDHLRRAPAAVVDDYCRRVGLPSVPGSLNWEPGLVRDWQPWEEWHGEVAASSGIRPPAYEREPEAPEGVDRDLYTSCLDHYERMLALGEVGRPTA